MEVKDQGIAGTQNNSKCQCTSQGADRIYGFFRIDGFFTKKDCESWCRKHKRRSRVALAMPPGLGLFMIYP